MTISTAKLTGRTGSETGVWQVHTHDSIHVFDLDARTLQRLPGADSSTHPTDAPQPLRDIEVCQVGECGSWTMHSDDSRLDYYRHSSSEVQRIERVTKEKK